MTTGKSPGKRQSKRDDTRERRITDEIIVDAYDSEEKAMGWYYYLDGVLRFPFTARCCVTRAISPLEVGEVVTVTAMAPETECEREMFVQIRWQDRSLAVPLAQLQPPEGRGGDPDMRIAIADWHYWIDQGYTF